MMGTNYTYIEIKRINNKLELALYEGSFNTHDICVFKEEYQDDKIILGLKARNEAIYDLRYQYTVNGKVIEKSYLASAGRWIGATYGLFARGNGGNALVKYFNTTKLK